MPKIHYWRYFVGIGDINKRFIPYLMVLKGTFDTPGKLSQVPPAEVLFIGCDRHTEVPVTVEI